MKRIWILLTMLLLLASSLSYADRIQTPTTPMSLYMACKEAETNEYARGFCVGAIEAFYSSIDELCVPDNITHGEIQEQIKKELFRDVPRESKELIKKEQLRDVPIIFQNALEFVKKAIHKKWP